MAETIPSLDIPPPSSAGRSRRASVAFCIFLWVAIFGGALVEYGTSFSIKPGGDDFFPVLQMQRGEELGLVAFFTRPSHARHYRPLQEMGTWAFASMFPDREFGIHVANMLGLGVLLLAVILWAREMPISRLSMTIAAGAVAFHPVLGGQMCGLDMYACTLAPGLMWIAAWNIYTLRDRTWRALAAALPIFATAILFKEYAYGTVTLGALVALVFRRSEPIGTAMTIGGVLGCVVTGLMLARRFTTPDDAVAGAAVAMPHLKLLYVPYNLALFGGSLLTPVSTAWLYTHRHEMAVLAAGGAGILAVGAVMAGGLWFRVKHDRDEGIALADREASGTCWGVFLILALAASSFPNNILEKVSENYTSGPLVAMALLAGLAADGWRLSGRSLFTGIASTAGIVLLAIGVASGVSKMEQIRDCGDRADRYLHQIASYLPEGSTGKRIALVYLNSQDRGPGYSVYLMPDDVVICADNSLDWILPHTHHKTTQLFVDRVEHADLAGFDLALLWDAPTRTFRPIGPPPATGG